jgi:hypothetical protein
MQISSFFKIVIFLGLFFIVYPTFAQTSPKKVSKIRGFIKNTDLEGEWILENVKAQIASSVPFNEKKRIVKNVETFKNTSKGKLKMIFQNNNNFLGIDAQGEKTTGTWNLDASAYKITIKTPFGTEYHDFDIDDANTTLTTSRGSAGTQKVYMIFKKAK